MLEGTAGSLLAQGKMGVLYTVGGEKVLECPKTLKLEKKNSS